MTENLLKILSSTNPPWFLSFAGSANDITNIAFRLNRENRDKFGVWTLRANKMRTVGNLFDEFSAALQFPYYFGENWNAFDECIADLDWLNAPGYLIIVLNSEHLLCDAESKTNQTQSLLKILSSAANEWSRPIKSGEAWDRPGKPFHVLFHVNTDHAQAFETNMQNLGHAMFRITV